MTDNLPERVHVIERKLDALSASVDERFDAVDKRFDEVSVAFAEQREYTEFAFDRLRAEMLAGFERVEKHMATREQLEELRADTSERFTRLDRKLDQLLDLQAARSTPRRSQRKKR